MIELDVANSDQVSSPTMMQVRLGDPTKRMIICSGIAIPEYATDDDENTVREIAQVRLRLPAYPLQDVTVHVGLASIRNDESAFTFAVDDEHLAIDEARQEWVLRVSMALRGDDTKLHRFSYQVIAIVADLPSRISGRLYWRADDVDVTGFDAAAIAALAKVHAQRAPVGTNSGQPVVADGRLVPGTQRREGALWSVAYVVEALPLGVPLRVGFSLSPRFPSNATTSLRRGRDLITVTKDEYAFSDQDYEVTVQKVR